MVTSRDVQSVLVSVLRPTVIHGKVLSRVKVQSYVIYIRFAYMCVIRF